MSLLAPVLSVTLRLLGRRDRRRAPNPCARPAAGPPAAVLRELEQAARADLAADRPEVALARLDTVSAPNASLRLLRDTCLVLLDRRAEAHADLHLWCKRNAAPLDARILLALLEWDAGETGAARSLLQRNVRHLADPRSVSLLLLDALERGDDPATQNELLHLTTWCRPARAVTDVLRFSLGMARLPDPREAPEMLVGQLANELMADETAIATLARRSSFVADQPRAALFARAVERALPELSDRATACEALARVAIARGHGAEGKQWISRGLRIDPRHAGLLAIGAGSRRRSRTELERRRAA